MSLRLRTALIGILIAVVAAAATASASYVYAARRIDRDVDRSLALVSTFYLDEVRRSPFADPITGQDLGDYTVQAIDAAGKRLPVSGQELPISDRDRDVALGRVGYDVRDVDIDGTVWRIRTMSTRYGAIQVALDLDRALAPLSSIRWIIALIGVSAAAAAGVVSWIVTRRALQPLVALTSAVEEVASGRLDIEVAGRGSSEIRRVAGAFNTTVEALRRSRAEQERLVQDAGHDLRTPLTSLMNNISLLQRHQLSTEDQALIIADLNVDVRSLKGLVDEIIDVASGAASIEEFAVSDVKKLATLTSAKLGRQHRRVIVVEGNAPVVPVQVQSYQRAVSNLVVNAIKYTDKDIVVRISVEGDYVWTDVLDRGPGLGEGDADRLFQRFWRADVARFSPGSGLGLAIVKDVALRHKGGVRATNRDGGGSSVGFSVATSSLEGI